MSGTATVTPGKTFSGETEAITNAKLNLGFNPTVQVDAGAITSRELAGEKQIVDPSLAMVFYEDFISATGISAVFGFASFQSSTSTATVAAQTSAEAAHPGIVACTLGNSATSIAWIRSSASFASILAGGGELITEWVFKSPSYLSNATDAYTAYIGLGTAASTGAVPANGIYFTYTHSANSGSWVGNTTASSSTTAVNSSVVMVVSTWTKLRAVVNAAGTSVEFFINGNSVGTSTTNIPTSAVVAIFGLTKTANSSLDASMLADYHKTVITFTTAR